MKLPLLLNVAFHNLNQDVERFGDRFRSFSIGGEFTVSRVLQLRVGYNSAARLIERMEKDGLVGQPDHVGRRDVLIDPDGHPI